MTIEFIYYFRNQGTNMRRIIVFVFIITALFSVNSLENDDNKVTLQWIKIKSRIRRNYEKRKLVDLDSSTLDLLADMEITEEIEPQLAELLYDIIVDNALDGKKNAIKAIDVLEKRFSDIKYFFNVTEEFAFEYARLSPHVVVKILNGLTNTLAKDVDENLHALKVVYDSAKTPYIIEAIEGTIPYGTELIVMELIAYIREFIRLGNEGIVEESADEIPIIAVIYTDIALEDGNYLDLPGAKDLVKEY